jgi:hypothetical protein
MATFRLFPDPSSEDFKHDLEEIRLLREMPYDLL